MPAIYDSILRDVHEVEPRAVIAGGAIRDEILGGEVKDIDVFLPDFTDDSKAMYESLYSKGWRLTNAITIGGYLKIGAMVATWRHPECPKPIQLIYKVGEWDPEALIRSMDFGACQVAYFGSGHFIYTAKFLFDIAHNKITLVDVPNEPESRRSARRAKSFKERYAGTDVVVDVGLGLRSEWPEHYVE